LEPPISKDWSKFTDYSPNFISAIAFNMENNKLWVDGEYGEEQYWRWFSPDGSIDDDNEFLESIQIACGMTWVRPASVITIQLS
jgi:hypothetical protein